MKNTALLLFTCAITLIYGHDAYAVPMGQRKPDISAEQVAQAEAAAKKATQEKQQLAEQAEKIKSELNTVNQKMINVAKQIQNGEDEIRKQQEDLDKLQQHLKESEDKFNAEHEMLVNTLSALQSLALRPSQAMLVQPLSPVDIMRSSLLLRGSVHSLRERAEFIRQSIEDINNQKKEIDKRLKNLAEENKNLAAQQQEMKNLSAQKSQMYSQISSRSKEAEQKANILASQAESLRDLLDKLEQQKKLQRRQMEEKERLAKQRAADEMRKTNDHSYKPTPMNTSSDFAKAKGKLSRPARGPIVTAFHQEMSKGVVSNGIDIKTAEKAQIISPYEGNVIFSGPFKNFANLIIIDHGEGYTSLLSGLGETDVKVGQTLLAGEPVGTMPTGNNLKLHMEIRKNNQPINPTEWLSQ